MCAFPDNAGGYTLKKTPGEGTGLTTLKSSAMTARLLEDLDTETFGFYLLAEDSVSFAENMRLFPGDAAQAADGRPRTLPTARTSSSKSMMRGGSMRPLQRLCQGQAVDIVVTL